MEIESSPLRRAAIFVSNVPKGRTLGFTAGGEERTEKKRAPGNDFTDNKRTVNSELEK